MRRIVKAIFSSSVLWGSICCFIFYLLVRQGIISNELIVRYTAGHPVEYITVAMFFIGMTDLVFRYFALGRESRLLETGPVFAPAESGGEEAVRVDDYLSALTKAEQVRGVSLLTGRLRNALAFFKHNGSPEDLEQELRYLSEEEEIRADARYGLVKMFIWAIPILGFLGTVIGITQALGNLNLTELETTGKLLAEGLQVAFDTTALALSLVFVIYFSMFFVRRRETVLFRAVDRIAEKELAGRFRGTSDSISNGSAADILPLVAKVMEKVAVAFEEIVQRQIVVWNESLQKVDNRAEEMTLRAAESLETGLRTALDSSSQKIIDGQQRLLKESVAPLIAIMERDTENLGALKRQMMQEEKLLEEVLRATGEITRLEKSLNGNLAALRETGHFEEAVNTLSAAVALLNNKTKGNPSADDSVHMSNLQNISNTSIKPNALYVSSPNACQELPITDRDRKI